MIDQTRRRTWIGLAIFFAAVLVSGCQRGIVPEKKSAATTVPQTNSESSRESDGSSFKQ